jgi:hypothetical protein
MCLPLGLQALNQHKLPELGRNIPVLHDAVLVHVVADFEVAARDDALIAKEISGRVAGDVAVEGRQDGLGDVFAGVARARIAVAGIEDEGRDFIC